MTPFEPSILMAPGLNTTGPPFEARSQHRCLAEGEGVDGVFAIPNPTHTCLQPLATVLYMENGENIITFIFLFSGRRPIFQGF